MSAIAMTIPDTVEQSKSEQEEWESSDPSSALIEARIHQHVQRILEFIQHPPEGCSFYAFEKRLIPLVFTLARLFLALFLCHRHEALALPAGEERGGRRYERRDPHGRWIGTFFGKVRYWRSYMWAPGGGYYPLDAVLQIAADRFTLSVVSLMSRLATKMSYAQVVLVLRCFWGWAPSQDSVERAVLGLGRRTAAWFEQAPLPEDDGEVLIIQIDSKATPTATEAELKRRRGKRRPNPYPGSARHRGRHKRRRRGSKKRRKKGDKSKNGKATTVVVIYTLRRSHDEQGRPILIGPLNRWVYASYAPKRHAFEIARREADRRGFAPGSGKTIQVVTDGDEDLEYYRKQYFPEVLHTLDIIHVIEYLWQAGQCLFEEGSVELERWVRKQKHRLYQGQIRRILEALSQQLQAIPKTGPGNKGRRQRLEAVYNYLSKRVAMMNYKELIDQDLEISSGAVEGAVRYVVAQRFDQGGMRWIRERAEPLLQLRCIEINGDWEAFMAFVHATGNGSANAPPEGVPLLANIPSPLPTLGAAA